MGFKTRSNGNFLAIGSMPATTAMGRYGELCIATLCRRSVCRRERRQLDGKVSSSKGESDEGANVRSGGFLPTSGAGR